MSAKLTGDYFDHVTVTGDRWDLLAYAPSERYPFGP
ncbi:hypothetical protein BR141012304_20644 [Brucella inopinata]|nr:hypothetical protein BR141012304_20644 [Brucella inopinata]